MGIPFRFQKMSSGASPDVSQMSAALSPLRTDSRTEFSGNLGGAEIRKHHIGHNYPQNHIT
jgi:hypothetical protein